MVEQQTLSPVVERLSQRVPEAIELADDLGRPVLVSVSEDIEQIDPLRLFANSSGYASERWYWEHPEEDLAIAVAGVADSKIVRWQARFSETKQAHHDLTSSMILDSIGEAEHPGLRFFSAFSFDPERKPDRRIWKGFPAAFLMAPRVMLLKQNGRTSLIFTVSISARRDADTILRSLNALYERTWKSLEREIQQTRPHVSTDPTDEDEQVSNAYRESVARASQAIRDGDFEKVVLARYRDISTSNYFDIPQTLNKLRTDYPGCYTFAVARQGSVFLGASPEQLIQQEQKQIRADSLAGSIRRGETPEEDAALADQLRNSQKDLHEHEICARAITEALEPLCAELNISDTPEILTFSNVHHLYTPVSGTLSNGSTLLDLVERLHPTPAVGGYPRAEAQAFIRENEPFDRGWYAAPVGWLDAEGNGEFIVALRSAIVAGQRARLFAGCGIMGESDPEQELAESNVKMRSMLGALQGEAS